MFEIKAVLKFPEQQKKHFKTGNIQLQWYKQIPASLNLGTFLI